MKAKVDGKALASALALVETVVDRSGVASSVSSLVVLEAAELGMLALRATDGSRYVIAPVSAEVEAAGRAAVSGQKLSQLVREVGSVVTIAGDEESLTFRQPGGGRMKLPGNSALSAFPQEPQVDVPSMIRVDTGMISEALRQAAIAAHRETNQGLLNAVHVAFGPTSHVNATDRYRMMRVPLPLSVPSPWSCTVPLAALRSLAAILKMSESASFGLSGNWMAVEAGPARLFVLCMEGAYPDFGALMEKASGQVSVEIAAAEQFAAAIRWARIVASSPTDGSDLERVVVQFGPEGAKVVSVSADGESDKPVDLNSPAPELTVAFNAEYMTDWLSLAGSSSVKANFTVDGGGRATIARLKAATAPDYVMTLMTKGD